MLRKIGLFFAKIGAYLKATWIRVNTDSPKYWQSIQAFLTWLTITTGIVSEKVQFVIVSMTGYGLDVPTWLQEFSGQVALIAFFCRVIAQLPIEKEAVSERKYEELSNPKPGQP